MRFISLNRKQMLLCLSMGNYALNANKTKMINYGIFVDSSKTIKQELEKDTTLA